MKNKEKIAPISAPRLKNLLKVVYAEMPEDDGAFALQYVLDNIDISQIKKNELDLIYRFIDNPETFASPENNYVPLSKKFDENLTFHTDNLVFLMHLLPSFEFLDKEASARNQIEAQKMAKILVNIGILKMEEKWDNAPLEQRVRMLKRVINTIRYHSIAPVVYVFDENQPTEASYKDEEKKIYFNPLIDEENSSLISLAALALHEYVHAEQHLKCTTDASLNRFFYYYVDLTDFSYQGNYIELAAYDRQDRFREIMANKKKGEDTLELLKAKNLTSKTR